MRIRIFFGVFLSTYMGHMILPSATHAPLLSSEAQAQGAFPSADQLLVEARKGRIEFLQAIGQVEASVEFLADKGTVLSYLRILDDLQTIADDLGFDDLGGDPLFRMKQRLTLALLKWINIVDDTQSDLVAFVDASSDDTLWRFLEAQGPYFGKARRDMAEFGHLYRKFSVLAARADASPYLGTGVKVSFRNAQAQYLEFLLRSKAINIAELRGYFKGVQGEAGFTAIANGLAQMASRVSSAAEGRELLDFSFEFLDALGKVDFFVPTYLKDMPSRALVQGLEKILLNKGSLPNSYVPRLFVALENRQIEEMLYLVRRVPYENLAPGQSSFMAAFAERGLQYYEEYGLARDAVEMREFVARIKLMEIMKPGVDGLYEVTLDGVRYDVTVLRDGVAEMIVVFGSEVQSYSMLHSFYDLQSKEVVLSRYYQDVITGVPNSGYNHTFRLKSVSNGVLRGVFDNGRKTYTVSAVRKSNPYTNYVGLSPIRREKISGVFVGSTPDPSFPKAEVRITETGRVATGSVTLLSQAGPSVTMSFSNGSLLTETNVVSLVSSETPRGNVIHLRGQVSGGVFRGQYIAAGTRKVIPLVLKRTQP
jgi:hypothetical protein